MAVLLQVGEEFEGEVNFAGGFTPLVVVIKLVLILDLLMNFLQVCFTFFTIIVFKFLETWALFLKNVLDLVLRVLSSGLRLLVATFRLRVLTLGKLAERVR